MSKENKKPVVGRPTVYQPEYACQALTACAELGATDKDLADIFGVCIRTVQYWKKRHPEFGQSVSQGKEEFDTNQVERSLLQAALGGTYEEVYEQEGKVVKKVTKHKAPDVKACLFWLKNREPQRWSDKAAMAQELGDDLAELLDQAKKRLCEAEQKEISQDPADAPESPSDE